MRRDSGASPQVSPHPVTSMVGKLANFEQLRELAPEIPWMPVLQGSTLASYLECAELYEDAGVNLGRRAHRWSRLRLPAPGHR